LAAKGAKVTFLDRKPEVAVDEKTKATVAALGGSLQLGPDYLSALSKYEVIVRSPGVRLATKELVEAKQRGITITSQTKLFFELCPCPIIGVTGTKGKGTTSTLIYEMLKKGGKNLPAGRQDVHLGGNIGMPPLDFLDTLTTHSIVVLELSSFQLQDLDKSPHIAVMLMITSEHLDYHEDIREYVDAKRNLLRFQTKDDFAVLNRDYPATNESDVETSGKVYFVSRERVTENGCYVNEGSVWVRLEGREKKVIDVKDIFLPGGHNLENVCAAVMAATLAGVEKEEIVAVLKTFKGLPHRLELAGEVKGVKFYDDSFSTTPETAIAAIQAFTQPEVLILGGSSKKSDFTELGNVIFKAKNIRAIIGIGEEWEVMKEQFPLSQFQFPVIEGAKDMKTVVAAASKLAKPGDVVLLSPACASFGMFQNYKDRGEQFAREVARLV
jgi:UDP-N-acetylmuramoylalanine--D-glutamate ligase